MQAAGYDDGPWGENIFKGPTSAEEAMAGHPANGLVARP